MIRQRAVFAPGDLPALEEASTRARTVTQVDLACVKVAATGGQHPWIGDLDFPAPDQAAEAR